MLGKNEDRNINEKKVVFVDSEFDEVVRKDINRKPTINDLRKENGLSEIPDGDIVLTKV